MMDLQSAIVIGAPIGLAIAAFGSAIGIGIAVKGAMEAIGRQPDASGKILTTMIIGAALIEALTIYALVAFFMLYSKLG